MMKIIHNNVPNMAIIIANIPLEKHKPAGVNEICIGDKSINSL